MFAAKVYGDNRLEGKATAKETATVVTGWPTTAAIGIANGGQTDETVSAANQWGSNVLSRTN